MTTVHSRGAGLSLAALALAWASCIVAIVIAAPGPDGAAGDGPAPAGQADRPPSGDMPRAESAAPRPVVGLGVRYGASISAAREAFGNEVAERDFDRIAGLGASFVVIDVHIAVAPPGERLVPGKELTLEGDDAVASAVAQAHAAGLAVGIWPRPLASPTGPRLDWQVFSGFSDLEDAFAREFEARSAAGALAARVGADAVFLLDGQWLPSSADFATWTDGRGERVALEADFRARLAEDTSTFSGSRFAHFEQLGMVEPTLAAQGTLPGAFTLSASLRGVLDPEGAPASPARDEATLRGRIQRAHGSSAAMLTIGLPEHDRAGRFRLDQVGGRADGARRESALLALAQAWTAGESPGALLLETYGIGGGGERGSYDVADLPEDVWRALADAMTRH